MAAAINQPYASFLEHCRHTDKPAAEPFDRWAQNWTATFDKLAHAAHLHFGEAHGALLLREACIQSSTPLDQKITNLISGYADFHHLPINLLQAHTFAPLVSKKDASLHTIFLTVTRYLGVNRINAYLFSTNPEKPCRTVGKMKFSLLTPEDLRKDDFAAYISSVDQTDYPEEHKYKARLFIDNLNTRRSIRTAYRGTGTALMLAALKWGLSKGCEGRMALFAVGSSHGFYYQFGMRAATRKYVDDGIAQELALAKQKGREPNTLHLLSCMMYLPLEAIQKHLR